MDGNTWKRVEHIFHEAIERTAAQRLDFLDEACGQDDALRREVEVLLEHHTRTGDLFDTPRELAEDLLRASADQALEHRSLGPYRLKHEIGRGGMGRVFLAEREDLPKRVALKLVREPLAAPDRILRFRLEERVLAGLEHPHIAQLLDAGVTADGSPYFAMEYVDGEPIATFCDRQRLPVHERLRLFLDVCSAVRYAHAHLVVHRDIKPSNILVGRDRRPKLLDFGVAKLLTPAVDVELTRTEARVFTLEYAAPEQLTGERVSTATDVYQLGALLYELMTGHPPLDAAGKSAGKAERIVLEREPIAPSLAVARQPAIPEPDGSRRRLMPEEIARNRSMTPERLRHTLDGDIDNIVLKALEKRPERRYGSVDAFVGDIQRFLEGLPILARPSTPGYRLKKFLRRHRTAAAIGLLVLGYAVTVTWSAVSMARERDRAAASAAAAQREATKSERVIGYLVRLFEGADPRVAQGDTITARELLARGVERANALADQPEVQGTLYGVTGRIYYSLGELEQAERLYRRAIQAWSAVEPSDSGEEQARALLGLARSLAQQNRFGDAEPLLRRVLELRGPRPPQDGLQQTTLFELYAVLHAAGHEQSADSAFAAWEATFTRGSPIVDAQTAARMMDLGETLGYRGQIRGDAEAIHRGQALVQSALAALRTAHGPRHPSIGVALNKMAVLLIAELNLPGFTKSAGPAALAALAVADSVTRAALELHRAIYPEANLAMRVSLSNRVLVLQELGRYDEAETTARKALAVAAAVEGTEGMGWITSIGQLARIELANGDYEAATAHFRQGRDWWVRSYGDDYLLTLVSSVNLAEALIGLERFEEAEALLTTAFAKLSAARGRTDRYTQAAVGQLVALYERWNRPAQAARFRALRTGRPTGGI